MKKLLCLLATTSIVSSAAITVVACGTGGLGDVTSLAQQLETKTRFIADVNQAFVGYINSQSVNLVQKDTETTNNSFFKPESFSDILKTLPEGTNQIDTTLSYQNLQNANSDLRNLLKTAEINNLVDTLASEKKEYQFLLQGMDQIFTGLSISNSITLTDATDKTDQSKEVYTAKFNITLTWQYTFNGAVETESIIVNNLVYNVATDQEIVDDLKEIATDLPNKIYSGVASNSNLFNFNETHFQDVKSPFGDHGAAVSSFYAGDKTQETLKDTVNKIVKEISGDRLSIEYKDVLVKQTSYLYNASFEHVLEPGGYFEQTMLKKVGQTTDTSISNSFDSDFETYLSKRNYVGRAQIFILENYGIDIIDRQFIEYGIVSLGGENPIKLTYGTNGNLEIEINPINLIYTYNNDKDFGLELNKLFTTWQAHWGVVEPEKAGAMFGISKSTGLGQEFWKKIRIKDVPPFSIFNSDLPTWYDPITEKSSFTSFLLETDDSGLNPGTLLASQGVFVDYTPHFDGKPTIKNLEKSFKLVVIVDNVKITINFAKAAGEYLDTFMYGWQKYLPIIWKMR